MTAAAPERFPEGPPKVKRVGPADDAPPIVEPTPRWKPVLVILGVWIVLYLLLKGRDTLTLPGLDHTSLHDSLNGIRDSLQAGSSTNPVMRATGAIARGLNSLFTFLQHLISVPDLPRPVPQIGWLGVAALATWVSAAIANWKMALLAAATFASYLVFGYWSDSMDLLIAVGISVFLAVLIGIPLAVLFGTSRRAEKIIEPVLDVMQTMPTFVYLLPLVLFFGIGVPGAVACTLAYAIPPLIRIGGHGIKTVNPSLIEVTDSLGQTWWQRLTKVQLPLARKTIIVGLNQTTMAALSMATIASYINGPGLGKPVVDGLTLSDVGRAFLPGILIVFTAIYLDRVTTAASERSEIAARRGGPSRLRRIGLAIGGVVALALLFVSRQQIWAAQPPELPLRRSIATSVSNATQSFTDAVSPVTEATKNAVSTVLLNPLQSLFANSPWWLAFIGILAIAAVLAGRKVLITAVVCLVGIRLFDLWNDAMVTLSMTLVATVLVMLLAVIVGVAMARNRKADLIIRPILDAGQTIPAFVYLIPVLAMFDPSRFSAIVAGIIYAAPASIKLVADGVSKVSPTTMEAVRSNGATTMQQILKAQLPMARPSLVLAANQGLLYVLAMAVIGGMVGAGALGYAVVLGFSSVPHWGKGLAAGITITLLGILLDKITRRAAEGAPRLPRWLTPRLRKG